MPVHVFIHCHFVTIKIVTIKIHTERNVGATSVAGEKRHVSITQ